MWSNQADDALYFAAHRDGDPDGAWQVDPALQGPKYADDHINLKSLQADASGRVFAAVKTSLDDVPNQARSAPQTLLLILGENGSWGRRTFGTVGDDHTRPIVLINQEARALYMFATSPTDTGGVIYLKEADLDNINFAAGLGTPFIRSGTDTHINNATSTKQTLSRATGLLVLASDDTSKTYLHNTLGLEAPDPTSTPVATNTPTG